MEHLYKKGTVMFWLNGVPAYQKIGNDAWDNWRSLEVDLQKPIEQRYGFKWTDEQVKKWYGGIMKFQSPND